MSNPDTYHVKWVAGLLKDELLYDFVIRNFPFMIWYHDITLWHGDMQSCANLAHWRNKYNLAQILHNGEKVQSCTNLAHILRIGEKVHLAHTLRIKERILRIDKRKS